jgi:hypothetical protein
MDVLRPTKLSTLRAPAQMTDVHTSYTELFLFPLPRSLLPPRGEVHYKGDQVQATESLIFKQLE